MSAAAELQIKSHRDLIAWRKAMDLGVSVYEVTKSFPKEEPYGLTSQIRRAAISRGDAEEERRSDPEQQPEFVHDSHSSPRSIFPVRCSRRRWLI